MKKVLIETKHFAHISIITSDMKHYDEAKDEIEGFVKKILAKYPDVMEDPEFRCNCLTEVGLISENLEQIQSAANEIATWADENPLTKFVG
ncbi:hypothetical protein EN12_23930 [Vibrio cholerae]|uniref:Uncharacterized protein n=1 Tax=Vibrio cholerae TaxID=666 RepID=A0A5B1BZ90_VIBCL|nr:hypothetical protein [Vibrio cholerae]AKO78147.1 hypothetical protein EN12_23930 [Vibrio cholerae]KAA1253095.1 hypothetical protein F0M16_19330 [Vibrio cholerae]HDV5593571.1 hypothetical protein [Vibrio cholerae]